MCMCYLQCCVINMEFLPGYVFQLNCYENASSATIDSGEFLDGDEADYVGKDSQPGMCAAGTGVEYGMIVMCERLWNLFIYR